MRKFFVVLVVTGFLGLLFGACETKKEEPKKTEPPKVEKKEATPAPTPAPVAASGSPCDAYAACCTAYADALGKVAGIPADAVNATRESCKQIDGLKASPGADQACQTALDGMKAGAEAYKAMPGFTWPDACK